MGCLFACFRASKHRKRRHLLNAAPSQLHRDGAGEAQQLDVTTEQQVNEEPKKPIIDSKDEEPEEQVSCNGKRKWNSAPFEAKAGEGLGQGYCQSSACASTIKETQLCSSAFAPSFL
ncbi:hypothetical protein GH714_023046 [Hevea brasiliensis]|uniref:Uncharacterized protein n=1 Tax=Hevea brasiliensis TaxID=3981 RepID=A0A6A6M3X0_HEVBR|nr:hypothetical protein GH714_023046 [Hevea brasiliensis]